MTAITCQLARGNPNVWTLGTLRPAPSTKILNNWLKACKCLHSFDPVLHALHGRRKPELTNDQMNSPKAINRKLTPLAKHVCEWQQPRKIMTPLQHCPRNLVTCPLHWWALTCSHICIMTNSLHTSYASFKSNRSFQWQLCQTCSVQRVNIHHMLALLKLHAYAGKCQLLWIVIPVTDQCSTNLWLSAMCGHTPSNRIWLFKLHQCTMLT